MPGSEITSLIKYITDALGGNNSFAHSDQGFKAIILSDLKSEIRSIDPKSSPQEYKRLQELFLELTNWTKENKESKQEIKPSNHKLKAKK
ncbi:MAG: hypothetical protein AAGF07_00275 [Patescibacteria group bacterium]